jgi:hypothetical protein
MFSIQPSAWDKSDKELRSIGVWSSIGHTQLSFFGMFDGEVLISKFGSINRNTTSSVLIGKVSSLSHKISNNSMEWTSFIVKFDTTWSSTFLSSAEGSEVLGSLRDNIIKELEFNDSFVFTD